MSLRSHISVGSAAAPGLLAAAMVAYAGHVWFADYASAWLNAGLPLLGLVYLLAYFWAWGSLVWRLLRLPLEPVQPGPLLLVTLGLCAAVLAILLLGALGLLQLSVFLPLSLVVIFVGLWLQPPWRSWRKWGLAHDVSRPEAALIAVLCALFALLLLLALVPMGMADGSWDSLAYHLAMGKIYLRAGGIEYLPWMSQSNFPCSTDLIFLHGLLLGNDQVAVLLNLFLTLVAAAALFKMTCIHLNREYALLAALLFLSFPETARWVNTCNVELGWTAFATMSLWCALEWQRQERRSNTWITLAAIFAGFAAGTKLPGILSAAAVGAVFALTNLDHRRLRSSLAPLLRYSLVFCVAASPCYIKSYLQTGTPLWPLSLGVFTVPDWNAEIHERAEIVADQRFLSFPISASNLVFSGWDWAWTRADLTVALMLLVGIAAFLRPRLARKAWPLLLVVGLLYLFWFFVPQQSRFLLPAIPCALLGLLHLTRPRPGRRIGRLAFMVFWISLSMLFLPPWVSKLREVRVISLPILRGQETREELLSQLAIYHAARQVSAHTPVDAKILLHKTIRGYYLDRDYIWGNPVSQTVIDYPNLKNPTEFRERMQQLGITHILSGESARFSPYTDAEYDQHVMTLLKEVMVTSRRSYSDAYFALYDLSRPPRSDSVTPAVIASSNVASRGHKEMFPPEDVVDGELRRWWGKRQGWRSRVPPTPEEPQELLLVYPRPRSIDRITLVGHPNRRFSLKRFVFQYERDGVWVEIQNDRSVSRRRGNTWEFEFPAITTQRLRLVITKAGGGIARVLEIDVGHKDP